MYNIAMIMKSFLKVLWLALQPFDTIQNYIGAFGLVINILITLGIISGGGILAFYNPQINQKPSHNWIEFSLVVVSIFAIFILVAAWKLHFQKDKTNDVRFAVVNKVLNAAAILEVTNESQPETFRATGRIFNKKEVPGELFPLYWEGYGENILLGNGDTRHLLIARQGSWPTGMQVPDVGHGLDIFKATTLNTQGFTAFRSGIWDIFSDGSPNKANPVYLEVVIKPISSSNKAFKACYVLEQPLLTKLIFRKMDPPNSDTKGSNH